jgi:hypothetical protein
MAKLGSRLTFEGPDENLGSAVLFLNDSLHGLTVYRIRRRPYLLPFHACLRHVSVRAPAVALGVSPAFFRLRPQCGISAVL